MLRKYRAQPSPPALEFGQPTTHPRLAPQRRRAPYSEEPGYYEPGRLWLYGNVKLLHSKLGCVPQAFGAARPDPELLSLIEKEAERLVLEGRTLVCGVHGPLHQRAAIVPLRWGAPRIVVFSGGFLSHLGPKLDQEPFRAARLWRYQWDAKADLALSRRAPEKLPTYARHNPTLDRLIRMLAEGCWPGLSSPLDPLCR
jgi:hypothetical protein